MRTMFQEGAKGIVFIESLAFMINEDIAAALGTIDAALKANDAGVLTLSSEDLVNAEMAGQLLTAYRDAAKETLSTAKKALKEAAEALVAHDVGKILKNPDSDLAEVRDVFSKALHMIKVNAEEVQAIKDGASKAIGLFSV